MKFSSAIFIVASLISSAMSATVTDVITDIQTMSTLVNTLETDVKGVNTVSIPAALAVHTDLGNLGSAIDKGTSDIKSAPIPFYEADGMTILNLVQTFETNLVNTLSQIVAKRSTIGAVPIGGLPALIKQDLINVNTSITAFDAALIESVPDDLVPSAFHIRDSFDAAFAAAITAYS